MATQGTDEKPAARANWGSHVEFILTLIGFAVGLGNVWRFPYLCFRNGGGAFIVPYFICLVVMGIPLFYMELCFGQFASLGPIKIWIVNPAMKGLGFAMVIVSAMIAFYYNVIIAVCIYYFFASMTSSLPWASCSDFDWASCYCRDSSMNQSDPDPWNTTRQECVDLFANEPFSSDRVTNPSEDYFYNRVLRLAPDMTRSGAVSWDLALCLLLSWVTVFAVLTKGIKSLGKVVYVTAIFPYILLTVLLVRGVTLEGSQKGIEFYLTPNVTRLADADVWSDAAVQIFFSLSACSGGLIAMASYNDFKNNVLRDSFLVPIINCLTSFYAGFVIFASLGFMAHQKGVEVEDVAVGGPGLAFIAYPEALAQMPVSPLWAILFFLMMIMLGFSSSFSIVETVLTGLIDEFPFLAKTKYHAIAFRGGACAVGFLLGLPMVTESGFHLLDIVDNATGGFPLLFVGLFETVAIVFLYGFKNFRRDIEMMLGRTLFVKYSFFYFLPMWCFVTPAGLLLVIVARCIQYELKSETDGDIFPGWADAVWWLIVLFPVLSIVGWFLVCFIKDGTSAIKPMPSWGPALTENSRQDQAQADRSISSKISPLPLKNETPRNGGPAGSQENVGEAGSHENGGPEYDNKAFHSEEVEDVTKL